MAGTMAKKTFKDPAEHVRAFEGTSAAAINAEIAAWLKEVGDVDIVAQEIVPKSPPIVMVYWRPRKKNILRGGPPRR